MKLIYLLGKITPRNNNLNPGIEYMMNVENFLRFETFLVKNGFAVINPASDFLLLLKSRDIELPILREVSLEKLRRCDAVIALPGWRESENCVREYQEAKRLKIQVIDMEKECPGMAVINTILDALDREEVEASV